MDDTLSCYYSTLIANKKESMLAFVTPTMDGAENVRSKVSLENKENSTTRARPEIVMLSLSVVLGNKVTARWISILPTKCFRVQWSLVPYTKFVQ
jgi:hypothetical protein